MKPTYEELERERNELAAQVERLQIAAATVECGLANSNFAVDGLDDLQEALDETPTAALAALKAQWHDEALKEFLEMLDESIGIERGAGRNVSGDTIEMIYRAARKFKQRAQDAGMETKDNQCRAREIMDNWPSWKQEYAVTEYSLRDKLEHHRSTDDFRRECRYAVIKISDVAKYLSDGRRAQLLDILSEVEASRIDEGKHFLECVVVERDWPEYEKVWEMLKKRVEQEAGDD